MNITQEVLDYTLLAEFVYVELEKYKFEYDDKKELEDFIRNKELSDVAIHRQEKMIGVLNKYEIVAFESFDAIGESDLQMMLLKDKSTGEYVISYRGTAGFHDAVITDLAQMGLKLDANDQFKESLVVTNYWKELYGLNSSNTTLSGHSLGGALAQLNSYYYGFSAYTINAFGFDAATTGGIPIVLDGYLSNQEILDNAVKNTDNIYNYISVAGNYPDFIAGGLTDIVGGLENTHIGEINLVKDISGGYFGGLLGSHSSIDINNSLEIYYDLMQTFNITNEELTSIIDSVHRTVGNQFLRTLDRIVDILGIEFQKDLLLLSKEILSKKDDNLSIGKINFTTYEDIVNSNDKAKLYSLINQIPFTISSSSVDLYENFDISNMSESELNDRGLMYEYIINNTPEEQREYIFMNYETKINLMDNSLKKPAIVFGNETSEMLYGKDTDDRIYAGKGDDKVIAGNGNDYVEGGLGNDTIEAGTGINYIDGGEGIDTISYKNITNSNKEGITLNLSLATAQAINSTTTDTIINVENVIGSRYADNITGKANSNSTITLDGGDGDDILKVGLNSVNKLFGGAGNDTLVSTLIGFKNESAGIDFSYGSSYLNGGKDFDTYVVKDYVTIEDDDGRGEIQTKYGKLQDLTIKTLSDGTILLLKNNPIYVDATTTSNPFAGYTSGAFNTALGNFGTTTTQGMLLTNYELIFKLQKDGNDLVLNDLTSNPTVIRIKNYTANSLNLNITQDMLDNLPNLDENQTPSPTNPTLIGTNEIDTLIGSEVNNTFISNAGNDTLKDISGGNDIYKFKKGDGADTIYDIKGNDTIIFDETVLKEDINFSQSDDLKSLIINYSPTDSITISNYFDSFSKIENIQLSTGEKLIPEFTTQTIGSNQAENLITGYGNDTISSNQGDDTIKDLNGNDTYTFKVGDGNDIIEDLDGIDKIVFENLSNEDLIFTQKDNNLVIHYSINDSVTILNYFDNATSNYLEKIAFKNDLETIDASNIITGTVNDDEINGTYFDDVITSNKGNDTLKGFYGNDTYKFSKGDGNNRIYDVKGDDTITFDETINKEDISFSIKDNNLLITYSATDTIEVLNYFDNTNKIENIKLSTGEIVEVTNIDKTLNGTEQNDTLIGSYGNDILIGNDGDDTLTGNVGADKLYGGRGFDTYVANDGDIINDSDNLGKIIFEGETLSTAIYDESKRVYVLEFEDKKLAA